MADSDPKSFWAEALVIVPLIGTLLVISYVANAGSECFIHEGVGWALYLVGVPCFLVSLSAAVFGLFQITTKPDEYSIGRKVVRALMPLIAIPIYPFFPKINEYVFKSICNLL